MSTIDIKIEKHGTAALVILNSPESRNALGPDSAEKLANVLKETAADPELKGIVLTGEGAFSGGGDLKGMKDRLNMPAEQRRGIVYSRFQGMIRTILGLPIPIVAAIDGAAVGFGLDIALACDSRLIGPKGFCRQGWAKLGLAAGTGGILLFRHRAPGSIWQAIESGVSMNGATMQRMGLGEQVSEGTARERALKRIELYSHMPRRTLEAYVALDRADLIGKLDAHLNQVLEFQMPLLTANDFGDRLANARN